MLDGRSLEEWDREHTCGPHQHSSNIGVRTYPDGAIVVPEWIQTIDGGERPGIDAPVVLRKIIEHVLIDSHRKDVLVHRRFFGIFGPAVKG